MRDSATTLSPYCASLNLVAGLLASLLATALLTGVAAALPDAAVARIAVKGTDLRDGDRVAVEVEVANYGDTPLPVSPVVFSIDDEPYAEWQLPAPIGPGESALWSFAWATSRGSHLLVATADPLNDVAEQDEANNSAFINIGVDEVREPSPWPVALTGIGAFLAGLGLAALARRAAPAAREGLRYGVRRDPRQQPPTRGR